MEEIRSFANQRMNLDADDKLLSPDETREIYNGISDIEGTMRMLDGNTQVHFTLPDGDNNVIGWCNDNSRNSIIYFVKNSLGNHSILRYRPNIGIDKILYAQPVLNFTRRINHASVIGDLLYWTDGYDVSFAVNANTPPRKINIAKAIGTNYPHTVTRRYQKGDFASQDGKVYEYINEQATNGAPVSLPSYWQIKGTTYTNLTEDRLYWILDRIKYPRTAEAPVVFYTDNPPAEYVAPEEPPVYTEIKYGLLYNWYAATSDKQITRAGWKVPTIKDWATLLVYMGGEDFRPDYPAVRLTSISPDAEKYFSVDSWYEKVGTNETGLNFKGSGIRYNDGFYDLTLRGSCISTDSFAINATSPFDYGFSFDEISGITATFGIYTSIEVMAYAKSYGNSIKCFREATESEQAQNDYTPCATYIGNDLKQYRTVKIGTQVWLADNLAETKYRNGDTIPEVTDNTAWGALTTGALCAYDNDWSNVMI